MKLDTSISLSFDGQCEEAFKLYEQCLGAKTAFKLTWGDSPMAADAPQHWRGKINHSTLILGDIALLGNDALPGGYQRPLGFDLMLGMNEVEDAERVFAALSEGGTVRLPLQETFWAHRFGLVTDRFGIPWGINCEKPAP